MRLRLVTWGFIACLAVADLAGAVWLWVLWQERGRPPAGQGAPPHLLGAGPAGADKPVAALAVEQNRSAWPAGTRPATAAQALPAQALPAHALPAQAPQADLNVACLLAVQAQMSASRQRSACP